MTEHAGPDDERASPDDEHAGTDDGPVLAASDVSVSFGDVDVLDGVGVDFEAGTVAALVGPNGAGKTTALEVLAGLRSPDAGTVTRRSAAARSVAYLPQSPRFRDAFTAREVVSFYASLVDVDVDVDALLDRVGLSAAADRRADALSGGMTRLLGLAQALVGDPPVVVLDEPTSGLDPDAADHVFEVVADIAADGRLVLTASHDLAAIQRRADRVLLLADGEVQLDGTPDALVADAGVETLRDVFSAAVGETGRRATAVSAAAPGGEQ
ncbi:ABC transporter ATP-binding protein [Halobacterium yunchengense]|uniref:ABC transporter ATP-binding protein n=1 Tax=Halobacterium yunchengense TaxID=3108497 RepID=UPI0030086DD2